MNTTVAISGTQMTQQSTQVVGQTGSVAVQAQVTAVGPGMIKLAQSGATATADDEDDDEDDDDDDDEDEHEDEHEDDDD